MTTYESVAHAKPDYEGSYTGFDHIHWWVGNAKQAANWYIARFGFSRVAYSGLETGNRSIATHVVRQGTVTFAFSSPLTSEPTSHLGSEMHEHFRLHGDGVKDVAFSVSNCKSIYASAMARGAKSIREPTEVTDEHGTIIYAAVQTYGDTVHSLIERGAYKGPFLPGFKDVTAVDALAGITPPIGLTHIDHVVGNMPDLGMEPCVSWYEKVLQFHRFWSVDDEQMHTDFSALRSIVVADYSEKVKMPINEPAAGKRKSQIQEYVDYYNNSGVQHIAMITKDIVSTITHLRARGIEFLRVPDTYYEELRRKLAVPGAVTVREDLKEIQRLNILVDFDEKGYLLQLFTRNQQDRPTVFLEVLQREGCEGFGAGNFKGLFEAIEREQAERGNLTVTTTTPSSSSSSAASASASANSAAAPPS